MEFLTVDFFTLINAAFLIVLGFVFLKKKNKLISGLFLFICISLATWNICSFILNELLFVKFLNFVVCLQLIAGMGFVCGLLYFSYLYPLNNVGRWHIPNIIFCLCMILAIVFTPIVSRVEVDDGVLRYVDGPGYLVFALYLILIWSLTMYKLVKSYREYPEYRDRIKYFIFGCMIFLLTAFVGNLILPNLGNYDWLIAGRLGATLFLLSVFYAMTKHEFLDVSVIVNKRNSWLVVLGFLLAVFLVFDNLTKGYQSVHVLSMFLIMVVAAFFAQPMQKFLLTTAKRKFVRGWYSTEDVFQSLSEKITEEKSREAIFREVIEVLDEVFEIEKTLSVVAIRDEEDKFSYYKISDGIKKISATDPLISSMEKFNQAVPLFKGPDIFMDRLKELDFPVGKDGVILPFHSPEYLEGLLILGERSSQNAYTDVDYRFFRNLITFVAPILYRLTPMEKLEQLYNESRQRLHEAEIQLIRAQKVEAIAHATRQCHHEIRTPLNIIRMGVGRIRTLEDLENYKKIAFEEIDHALTVVEETLAITDVSDEQQLRQTELVNVNDIVRRCLRLIDQSRYKVLLELSELPPVPAMGSDIQVVIINLIHNAIDAMPDGGTLAFASRQVRDTVEIDVEDTGYGIPEAMRSKVWEPYVSGKSSDFGNSTAGRGWGLTIVNRIISEHGGTINFESAENHGTKFTISLPLHEAGSYLPDDDETDSGSTARI